MIFLIKTLQLILALSILVVIHEFGHFGFARLFRVRVHKFYMFFNPSFSLLRAKKINGKWQFRFFAKNLPDHVTAALDEDGIPKTDKKGKPIMVPDDISKLSDDDWRKYPESTEWGIGWIPFGGYCAIAGMVDETTDASQLEAEPQDWEYRSRPAWQRLFMISGGVLFNFILAIVIYAMLLFVNGEEYLPVQNAHMGYKYCQTALNNGFENGDIIETIESKNITQSKEVVEKLIIEGKQNVSVKRDGRLVNLTLPKDFGEQMLEGKEKQFMTPIMPFVVDSVIDNSIAYKAGMQKGDSVVGIDDKTNSDLEEIFVALQSSADKNINLNVYREGRLVNVNITPDSNGKVGVGLKLPNAIFKTKKNSYGFLASFPAGWRLGWDTMVSYVKQFRLVFTKAGAKSIGGFGTIGNLFPATWDWTVFWNMTALLSVILAFMNILPIPILDGGYILFIIYEMITGKKPSDKFLEISLTIGMVFIFALLIYANGSDIVKLFAK